MCRGLIILFLMLLGCFGLFWIAVLNHSLVWMGLSIFFMFAIIFFHFVFVVMFLNKKNKKTIKHFEKKYILELLESKSNDIYVLKNCNRNGINYVFSYFNEDGQKIISTEERVKIKDSNKKPCVEIYTEEYKPNGFLDFLFYSKRANEKNNIIYVLYVNDNNIKMII